MWCRLACAVIVAAVSVDDASAQESVAQFYKAKQITVIVGSSAGGATSTRGCSPGICPGTFPAIPRWW